MSSIIRPPAISPATGPQPGPEAIPLAPAPDIRSLVLKVALVIAVTFGGFFLWAALAELSSAVGAGGRIIVESHSKTIQHLEGGIIRDLLVRNGDAVQAGQPLIELEVTRPRAEVQILRNQYVTAAATRARLRAEIAGEDILRFDEALLATAQDDETRALLANQREIFTSRRTALAGQIDIHRRRILELGEQIKASQTMKVSVARQIELIGEELVGTRELFEKGYAPKTKVLALERVLAELQGEAGTINGRIAEARETIAKAELEIADLQNRVRAEAIEQLKEAEVQLADLTERMGAAEDVLRRTVLRAPEDGVVQNLRFHTIGGVIPAGAEVLDLVPREDRLVVDVKVRPEDIDVVHVGQKATVYLEAYNIRRVPPVDGEVTYVSADVLHDQPTGTYYFAARVQIAPDALENLQDIELYPGMPANAMIIIGERTVFDYLVSPFLDVIDYGMREE